MQQTTQVDDGITNLAEKMRFPKKDRKETIHYNSKITVSNTPAKAYEYVVNGKSAIEWIIERYQVTTHKESGIVNDPNDWGKEVGNPRYILDLLLSVINVSVQTVDIVNSLPNVDFGAIQTEGKSSSMEHEIDQVEIIPFVNAVPLYSLKEAAGEFFKNESEPVLEFIQVPDHI